MTCIRRRSRSYNDWMRSTVLILAVAIATPARAQLDDARLGTSAAALQKLVDRATQEGLPSDLVLNKVREGLAKLVPPPRITVVASALVEALEKARSEAQPFYAQGLPPPGLLKALVEAHAANVSVADAAVVMRAGGRERAIQVLTDLVQRGYPSPAAPGRARARKVTSCPSSVGASDGDGCVRSRAKVQLTATPPTI